MTDALLIAPYSLWRPHLAVDLELALKCAQQGESLTWLECRGELVTCDISPDGRASRCARCISRRDLGIKIAGLDVTRVRVGDVLEAADLEALAGLPKAFGSVEELRAFRFRGLDAGFAAMSSTVWVARDSEIDISAKPHRERVHGFLRSACALYLATGNLIARGSFKRAYLFNGRMAPMRGAFRAEAESLNPS